VAALTSDLRDETAGFSFAKNKNEHGNLETVDSEQWTVDSEQWTVDSEQWTVDSGQKTVKQ
jgi:hypothetical protein